MSDTFTCSRCKLDLPKDAFAKNARYKERGYTARCKKCLRISRRESKERHRDRHNANNKAWVERNRHKVKAQKDFNNAIAAGRIKRATECSKCGATGAIEGHHKDYTKPFDVIWLCRPCHVEAHTKEGG